MPKSAVSVTTGHLNLRNMVFPPFLGMDAINYQKQHLLLLSKVLPDGGAPCTASRISRMCIGTAASILPSSKRVLHRVDNHP
jgi:hypothetical protein